MSGRFGKFFGSKGMKIVPSYIGRIRETAETDIVDDGFIFGSTTISNSGDSAEQANDGKVIDQDPSAAQAKDYETSINLTVRSFSFSSFAFTPFSFTPFSFTPFSFTPFSFVPFSFTPFTVFGFTPFTVFGFSPITFSVFGFSPITFSVFGFSPVSAFKVFGFSPVYVARPAIAPLETLIEEENPSDI